MWSHANNNYPYSATVALDKIETMETECKLDVQDDGGRNTLNNNGTVQ